MLLPVTPGLSVVDDPLPLGPLALDPLAHAVSRTRLPSTEMLSAAILLLLMIRSPVGRQVEAGGGGHSTRRHRRPGKTRMSCGNWFVNEEVTRYYIFRVIVQYS